MKEFDLEKAKAGAPVMTRDGVPARILCFDRRYNINPGFPILALVDSNGDELCRTYSLEGIGSNGDELMMKPEKTTLWANVYKSNHNTFSIGQTILHLKREDAESSIIAGNGYIGTVKIEVEV